MAWAKDSKKFALVREDSRLVGDRGAEPLESRHSTIPLVDCRSTIYTEAAWWTGGAVEDDIRPPQVGELWVIHSVGNDRPELESYPYEMPGERARGRVLRSPQAGVH